MEPWKVVLIALFGGFVACLSIVYLGTSWQAMIISILAGLGANGLALMVAKEIGLLEK